MVSDLQGMAYGEHLTEINNIAEELFNTGEVQDPQEGADIIIQVMEELDGGYYD